MNQLKLISKYRSQLMGLAIIWVMIFHASFGQYIDTFTLRFLPSIGYGGVDIFFFLSGFGLFYSSLNKKETLLTFYLKRLVRVLPAFVTVCLLSVFIYVYSDFILSGYIGKIFSYDFWHGKAIELWYVPAILILYIFFPLYLRIFKKFPYALTIVSVLAGILLTIFAARYVLSFKPYFNVLFLSRVPIFCIGVLFGKLSLEEDGIAHTYKLKIYLYLFSLLGFLCLYTVMFTNTPYMWFGLLWFPFILITPGLVLILSNLFEKYQNILLSKFLLFFGKISLELYLIHVLLFLSRDYYMEKIGVDYLYLTLFFILLSLLLAYFLSIVMQYVSKKVGNYINKNKVKIE